MPQYVHMGFDNWLHVPDISCVVVPGSAPSTRAVVSAKKDFNILVDMTEGRRTKSIIYLKSGRMVLSALTPDTIIGRIQGKETSEPDSD